MHLGGKNEQDHDMGGDLELIHVISHMWQLKISILDFGGGTKNIVTWYFGHQKTIKGAHVVLLYNGSTHFTGTGNFFILGTCNTFYTVLLNQTPSKLS